MSVRGKGAHNGVSRAFGNVRGLGRAFLYLSIYEPSFITRADRAARRAAMLILVFCLPNLTWFTETKVVCHATRCQATTYLGAVRRKRPPSLDSQVL